MFIDPGHGGKDPGAVANGLQEKDIVLSLAKRIREILANEYENVAVKMSRTDDSFPSLNARTSNANSWGADFFLSLHINAGGGTGFESYIYVKTSGKTADAQTAIHDAIMKEIGGRGVQDRGRKQKNYHVLRETKMSSILTENLFIDSNGDADKLKNADFLERVARGHTNGLEKAFDLKRIAKQADEPESSPETLFRVQLGAFSKKSNAEILVDELKGKGYSPYIVQE